MVSSIEFHIVGVAKENDLINITLLTSSPLTKIGHVNNQVLQEEKIFPMIPSSVQPDICMKMLRNLIEKLEAKFLAITLCLKT